MKNESLGDLNRVSADQGMLPEGVTWEVFPLNLPSAPHPPVFLTLPLFKPAPKGILSPQGRLASLPPPQAIGPPHFYV